MHPLRGAADPWGTFYGGHHLLHAGRYPLRHTGHRLAGDEGGEDLPIAGVEDDGGVGAAGAAAEGDSRPGRLVRSCRCWGTPLCAVAPLV
jgi:hypothetical protein